MLQYPDTLAKETAVLISRTAVSAIEHIDKHLYNSSMSTSLLIRHLLGRDVTVIDTRKPTAAFPRYVGRLTYENHRYSVGVYGLDFLIFRLAQVIAVEDSTITLGTVEHTPIH